MAVPVRFEEVSKRFGDVQAVHELSLRIEAGELFFLLGPSGCGKTTLLRCLAGFCRPDAGRIFIGDADVTDVPAHRRDTGMVFQSYALWPHLTVRRNVAFGLEMRREDRRETGRRVAEALALVRMSEQADRKPNELSGGQQQRVALARALVIRPRCLLLDEPLSNLDAKLRLEMRGEIRRLCKEAGLTAIYVTHDQKEALSVADRLAVLRRGRVMQVGTPEDVYRRPNGRFVAGFIGEANFLEGRVVSIRGGLVQVRTPAGMLSSSVPPPGPLAGGDRLQVMLRPEALRLEASPPPEAAPNVFEAAVAETVYLGEVAQHRVLLPVKDRPAGEPAKGPLEMKAFEINPRGRALREAGKATLQIDPRDVVLLRDGEHAS